MNPIQIINLLNVPRIGPHRVKKILAVLGQDPVHIDELAHSVDMDITSLLEILLKLELKNAVQQIGGKQFVRA